MTNDLYSQAIADAKQLREIAEQNAKNAIIQSITPKIRELIDSQILGESTDEIVFTTTNTDGTTTYAWTNDNPAIGLAVSGPEDATATTIPSIVVTNDTTNAVVAKPNSSAPRSAAIITSLPVFN